RAEEGPRREDAPARGVELERDALVLEAVGLALGADEDVLLALDAARHLDAAAREPLEVEAVELPRLEVAPERAEEARLQDVGPAVLRAEDVAVAAVVAEVGEVRELV